MLTEKSLDHFEQAVQMLLAENGWDTVPHLDAVSLRTFGFRCRGEIEEWFQPAIPLPQAVRRLEKVTGTGIWHLARLEEAAPALAEEAPFVLGPLKASILPDVRSRYYRGCGEYFYCSAGEKERFYLCDLNGLPVIPVEKKRLQEMLQKEQPYALWLEKKETAGEQAMPLDYRRLLAEGLAYRASLGPLGGRLPENIDRSSHRLSFQYGVINYGIQLRKTLELVREAAGEEECFFGRIKELFRRLYWIREAADMAGLLDWDKTIWRAVNEYVSGKGIAVPRLMEETYI